jgi:hypothetical protein
MPTPNRAVCVADPKIQRNGGPVCGGAPFNLTNPSHDVQVVNVGLNGFNPKIVSKMIPPQRAPTDAAVAMKHVPIVVPGAHFTSRMLAGMNAIPNKKFTKSIFTGRLRTSRLGSSSSFVGADEPRDHEDDDSLGHDERVPLLQPSEAATGGDPATPIATTPSIETLTTFGRRFGQSLPPFVEEIESQKKSLTGHARGSNKCGSISRCTKRWTMVLSFVWLCTFIVQVDSFDPLPDGNGCCDEGNILKLWFFFDCTVGPVATSIETLKLTAFKMKIILYTTLDSFFILSFPAFNVSISHGIPFPLCTALHFSPAKFVVW